MSYRVLARTYRSNTFDEIVGQDAIACTLKNAINSARVHHGYLFTGTRGVGKTSMARILAKSLNCLSVDAPTVTPCCTCDSCVAIAEGEDVDVVEIDAASNTGVDNIRELRSNAAFRPARARFKVYIIDEVHMLSTGAFNALLKTLEEPPSHVKFVLATTELQKVPATIQSRCQRFDFRAIDVATIAGHLRKILDAEKIKAQDEVLRRIARLGGGSMRDALSLLDKVLSYESGELTTKVVDEVLPPPHDELAAAVMGCVAKSDAAGALKALDDALQTGRTVDRFCEHLIEHVRTLMLMEVCGSDTDLCDVSEAIRPKLAEQASQFDAPTYVYMIALLEELRRNVKFSGAARALADAAVVRLAMSRQFTDIADVIKRIEQGGNPGASSPAPVGLKKKVIEPPGAGVNRADSSGVATPTVSPVETPTQTSNGTAGPILSAEAGRVAATSGTIRSADWRRVENDPFVKRVTEAVEGTLFHVRKRVETQPEEVPAEETVIAGDEDTATNNTE